MAHTTSPTHTAHRVITTARTAAPISNLAVIDDITDAGGWLVFHADHTNSIAFTREASDARTLAILAELCS